MCYSPSSSSCRSSAVYWRVDDRDLWFSTKDGHAWGNIRRAGKARQKPLGSPFLAVSASAATEKLSAKRRVATIASRMAEAWPETYRWEGGTVGVPDRAQNAAGGTNGLGLPGESF